jgi:hypothetical protein
MLRIFVPKKCSGVSDAKMELQRDRSKARQRWNYLDDSQGGRKLLPAADDRTELLATPIFVGQP